MSYKWGDYEEVRKNFIEVSWEQELTATDVDTHYLEFCGIYKTGVLKQVKKLNEWLSIECVNPEENRNLQWNRHETHNSEQEHENYKTSRERIHKC